MQFGFLLLGEYTLPHLLRLAQMAEAHGVDTLWYADEKFFRDPYVSLTFLAQHTHRLGLGICVTDPFTRHPALTAMAMATLDEASDHKSILGLGAGFSGLQAMGLSMVKPARALREAIELIRRLWAGETVVSAGQVISFHGGQLNFSARPNIPIYIASSGRQILRLAGEIADGVILGDMAAAGLLTTAMAEVEQGAQRAGRVWRDLPLIARVNLLLTDDVPAAYAACKPWITVGLWDKYPKWDYYLNYQPEWEERFRLVREFVQARGGAKPRNVGDHALIAPYSSLVPDEMVRDIALVGTVHEVVEQLVEIGATGVSQVMVYPMALPGQDVETVLTQFVTEVAPRVQARLSEPVPPENTHIS